MFYPRIRWGLGSRNIFNGRFRSNYWIGSLFETYRGYDRFRGLRGIRY